MRIVQFVQDGADSRLLLIGSRNPAGGIERCREAVGRETKCPYSSWRTAIDTYALKETLTVAERSTTSGGIMTMPLDELSDRLQLSKQTIVRWVDRHLIDADLHWTLSDNNEEVRMIEISPQTMDFVESFAAEYREDVVSRTEARRILKQIDRKKIKKLIRAGDVKDVEVDEETRIVVGSIEDYLMARESDEEEED